MDPANQFAPLFEAQLELREPDLVFVPPLDSESPKNFSSLVQGLINDILKMANLIPRIATHYDYPDYQVWNNVFKQFTNIICVIWFLLTRYNGLFFSVSKNLGCPKNYFAVSNFSCNCVMSWFFYSPLNLSCTLHRRIIRVAS